MVSQKKTLVNRRVWGKTGFGPPGYFRDEKRWLLDNNEKRGDLPMWGFSVRRGLTQKCLFSAARVECAGARSWFPPTGPGYPTHDVFIFFWGKVGGISGPPGAPPQNLLPGIFSREGELRRILFLDYFF